GRKRDGLRFLLHLAGQRRNHRGSAERGGQKGPSQSAHRRLRSLVGGSNVRSHAAPVKNSVSGLTDSVQLRADEIERAKRAHNSPLVRLQRSVSQRTPSADATLRQALRPTYRG